MKQLRILRKNTPEIIGMNHPSVKHRVLSRWFICILSFCGGQALAQPTLTTTNTAICGSGSVNLNSLITTNASTISWSEKPQAVAIACGGGHSLALLSSGKVIGWGWRIFGQVDIPNTAVGVKAIAAGLYHSLALLDNGTVIGWGRNFNGQISIPNTAVNVKAISAGGSHSLALLNNGSVIGWGDNAYGQSTIPNTVVGATAIADGSYHATAILGDGSVVAWGFGYWGQNNVPTNATNARALAEGGNHSLVLTNTELIGWGRNADGELNMPSAAATTTAIAAGFHHSLSLLQNGTVIGWGDNINGQTTTPNTVVGATAIAAGDDHSLALLNNGTVIGWGYNFWGQAAGYDPLPLSNTTVSPTATKTYYVVVKDANGNIKSDSVTVAVSPSVPTLGSPVITNAKCFGNADGQVVVSATGGGGNTTYSMSPNTGSQSPAGTFKNLTAQTYTFTATDKNGCSNSTTATVSQPTNISFSPPSVTNVPCYGGSNGQVVVSATGGGGNMTYSISPNIGSQNPIGTFTGLTAQAYTITATDINGCASTTSATVTQPAVFALATPSVSNPSSMGGADGSVWVGVRGGGTAPYTYTRSGSNTPNSTGQFTGLSAGTYSFTATDYNGCTTLTTAQVVAPPTLTTTNTTITCNSSIDLNSLITTNGSTISWSEKPQVTAIAAGAAHSLALLSDGSVIGWGDNNFGQTTVPNTVVGATAIATGYSHSLALLSNGAVISWGDGAATPNTVVGAKGISAGNLHSLAVLDNGAVIGWGSNGAGQATVPNGITTATGIGTGINHSLTILSNGSVVGWGSNNFGQATAPNTVVDAKAVAGGGSHSLALLNDGSVVGWGSNSQNQITIPNTVVNVKAIAAGSNHSLALLSNGSVVGWGSNLQNQLNVPNTVVGATAISTSSAHVLALLGNGSVIGWGNNVYGQSANYDPTPLSNSTVSPSANKTYYVVVKDANGNKTTGSVTITVGNPALPTTTTNNALNFDGSNDYVEVSNCANIPLSISDALTIEYWFKGSNQQSAVRLQPDNNSYIISGSNNAHLVRLNNVDYSIATGNAADGNWHHVAMTWQRNTTNGFKSYLDGNLVSQANTPNTALPNISSGMYLGALNGSSEFLNGALDEVRIWNIVRTQTELQNDRSGCTTLAGTAGLVVYYQFNHGAADGNNNSVSTLSNSANANNFPAILRNFTRTGSISNWVVSPLCTVSLPVELLSFSGKNTEGGNLLTWTTAEEKNALNFDIERSRDGQFFTKIGETKATGSNSNYTFTDDYRLSPVAFYRLKINDLDSKMDYSKIIGIESKGKSTVKIYPSVTSGELTVENAVRFEIVNSMGQVVSQSIGYLEGIRYLNVNHLPNGFYLIKGYDTEGGIFSEKIVKQ